MVGLNLASSLRSGNVGLSGQPTGRRIMCLLTGSRTGRLHVSGRVDVRVSPNDLARPS